MDLPEDRLKVLDIVLPSPVKPVANYTTYVQSGNLLFLSGHGFSGKPTAVDIGKIGRDLTVEQGYFAARNVGIYVLATLKSALGELKRVKRIVRVLGMVNCTDDFEEHPKVINGFSDLMVEVFGDNGKHVRSAVGMNSLPRGIAIEIEVTLEIEN
ncbi:RidA family protein [Nafulsella turpanensis]|uniref:RidA family protein n=1 Tax=Nafulsella turpanensis TaxID=1265690 RepID=UPI00034BD847|nr:RidA family protein [Nafulsella turpanensis]